MGISNKFLIVEDDALDAENLRHDLSQIVRDATFLGPATSYAQARTMLEEEQPDIAFLDIELADRSTGGIDLARYIKSKYKTPFIFLTGLPDEQCFNIAKTTLPVNFLKKPYDLESLKRTTLIALQHAADNAENDEMTIMVKPLYEDKLWINTGRGEYTSIKVSDIAFVKANDHYLQIIHRHGHKLPLFKCTLKDFFRDKLAPYNIFHCLSRSLIIQLNLVEKIVDNHIVIGENRFSIPKNSREELLSALNIK